ncbi:Hypothetical predicted protein [Cloeon dipterum]|nr:Hypothetical predicted protein [Cloeon dipterum]
MYLTMFVMSTGFTIILTAVWPYLTKLDPNVGKEFLGFVTAAGPLAETIFSPILGYWSNKSGSARQPLLATLALMVLASAGYSLLEAFPASTAKYWMIITRFLIGVSAANVTVIRSYISAATTLDERTGATSILALCQVMGYIFGPVVQSILTSLLGNDGFPIIEGFISMNMYTSVGWVIVVLSSINFVLLLPQFFTEQHIAVREEMKTQGISTPLPDSQPVWKKSKLDYLAAFSLIFGYFVLVFNIALLENLGIPIVMDQFAWTNEEAVYYMGIVMAVGAIISVTVIALLKFVCKYISEANLVIYGGFLFMFIGRLAYIPWGDAPPQLQFSHEHNLTNAVGCPVVEQPWCEFTPAMTLPQVLIGYLFLSIGYPIGVTLLFSIFSKILGSRPQGVWMGLMMGTGSFARAIGSIVLSIMYVELGTTLTFSITSIMILAYGVWLVLVHKRLKPNDRAVLASPRQVRMIVLKENMNGKGGNAPIADEERQALRQ